MDREKDLLRQAYRLASNSPDPSTQNGAFLLNEQGRSMFRTTGAWNDLPAGVAVSENRWERPAKYHFVEHAERATILRAARQGIPTKGATMVCPWTACADCARAIIGAGITHLITHQADENARWGESIQAGMAMLEEAGVEVTHVLGKLGLCAPVRRDGVTVSP
jgi:deoxycytidylate deaminase